MGLTTADVPTPRVSALMRLKSQNCPQMSVHTSSHTHTHTRVAVVNSLCILFIKFKLMFSVLVLFSFIAVTTR